MFLCFLYFTVLKAETFEINKGMTGTWYNANTSGQGQLIEVFPDSQQIFLAWFTFTELYENKQSQQQWWTALGTYEGSSAQLILFQTVNGLFNNPQEVKTIPIGELQLQFNDCNNLQLTFSLNSGISDQIELIRLVPDHLCEELNVP